MERELQEYLNDIANISFQIIDLYDELENLMFNKDNNPNYYANLDRFINKLKSLKNKEYESYQQVIDNISYASEALDYFNNHKPNQKEDKAYYCFERIRRKLSHILTDYMLEEGIDIPNGTVPKKAGLFLEEKGFDEEEAKRIILKIAPMLEKSLATALHNLHLQSLKNITDISIRKMYIKRILKEAIGIGGDFENELINHNFEFLPNNLQTEVKSLNINDSHITQELINSILLENMSSLVGHIMTIIEPEYRDEYFMNFKATILHLDNEELDSYKAVITYAALKHNFDATTLLKEIDAVINLRKKSQGKKM